MEIRGNKRVVWEKRKRTLIERRLLRDESEAIAHYIARKLGDTSAVEQDLPSVEIVESEITQ